MKKCYEYKTSIGRFYIIKHENRYHAIYSGISICNCNSAAEVASVLGNGYRFSPFDAEHGEIDTTNLRIPVDLADWICGYFMPDITRVNFEHSKLKTQNTQQNL